MREIDENEKAYRIAEGVAQNLLAGLTEPIKIEQVPGLLETSFNLASCYPICADNARLLLKAGVIGVMILSSEDVNNIIKAEVGAWVEIENAYYSRKDITMSAMIGMVMADKANRIGIIAIWQDAVRKLGSNFCLNCGFRATAHSSEGFTCGKYRG